MQMDSEKAPETSELGIFSGGSQALVSPTTGWNQAGKGTPYWAPPMAPMARTIPWVIL